MDGEMPVQHQTVADVARSRWKLETAVQFYGTGHGWLAGFDGQRHQVFHSAVVGSHMQLDDMSLPAGKFYHSAITRERGIQEMRHDRIEQRVAIRAVHYGAEVSGKRNLVSAQCNHEVRGGCFALYLKVVERPLELPL